MSIYSLAKLSQIDADKAKYKLQGFSGTAAVNSVTNVDWKFPQERWISGGRLNVSGATAGDTITIQIIDIDNVLGFGANVVLNTFVEDMPMMPNQDAQAEARVEYVSLIPANIYMRAKYTNTSMTATPFVGIGIYSHIPTA